MSQRLSARQEECLRLTAFLTDKEIAARLKLSEATVKKHVHEACRRMGVNRRKAALALLERNVPGPKDPIGDGDGSAVDASLDRESDHGNEQYAASPLDVGGSGGRAGQVQPDGASRSRPDPSAERTGGRRGAGGAKGTAAAGAQRGMGHGAGGRPERRLGYRPPPRSWAVRLLILLVIILVTAVLLKAVADLILDYAGQAQEIGHVTSPEVVESARNK
ncbi:helix-turn-helix transcriptional regulator [Roseibacterium beibuensis]|uniref:helix-turn-helix domain-containing protein n=1 Tax=[Roseibacterium] beibuensis TaxID=1193142 RepID=UPI00217E58F2|nr:helix-turn-helix transcriptional regulator [Roseibacterium beibuensis]MCS6626487.1 helix-turn-helix transcriptional regulator [Roseibacterium beibuensis]